MVEEDNMDLNEVLKNLELKDKINKLKDICNAGYCEIEEFDSFDEDDFELIEMDWKHIAKPYIEKETGKILFIEILGMDEVVNGCRIVRPYEGTDNEIDAIYKKISVPKKCLLPVIGSACLLAFSVFITLFGVIMGFVENYITGFFSFAYYMSPLFIFVTVSFIALTISLKKGQQ